MRFTGQHDDTGLRGGQQFWQQLPDQVKVAYVTDAQRILKAIFGLSIFRAQYTGVTDYRGDLPVLQSIAKSPYAGEAGQVELATFDIAARVSGFDF